MEKQSENLDTRMMEIGHQIGKLSRTYKALEKSMNKMTEIMDIHLTIDGTEEGKLKEILRNYGSLKGVMEAVGTEVLNVVNKVFDTMKENWVKEIEGTEMRGERETDTEEKKLASSKANGKNNEESSKEGKKEGRKDNKGRKQEKTEEKGEKRSNEEVIVIGDDKEGKEKAEEENMARTRGGTEKKEQTGKEA